MVTDAGTQQHCRNILIHEISPAEKVGAVTAIERSFNGVIGQPRVDQQGRTLPVDLPALVVIQPTQPHMRTHSNHTPFTSSQVHGSVAPYWLVCGVRIRRSCVHNRGMKSAISAPRTLSLTVALAVVTALTVIAGPPASAEPRIAATVATGLTSPWGLAFLPDGTALVSERDTGRILRVDPSKPAGANTQVLGTVPGSTPDGEGGLLGIAVPSTGSTMPTSLFAYTTTRRDNRVVRIELRNDATRLGASTPILTGIPKNSYHNGGRILVASDGTLYVATGDAGDVGTSQNRRSLAGKVLHINPDGTPAPGNPNPKSPIFSLGHRNVQGLAFDSAGKLWASEFGSREADELNALTAGGNYGWPIVEGTGTNSRFRNPEVTWSPTSLASPSGIAIRDNIAYVASLRGEVLWQVPLTNVGSANPGARTPRALNLGDLGRLRTIEVAPDGSLWLITSNTDGRGDARRGDDRILRLVVD